MLIGHIVGALPLLTVYSRLISEKSDNFWVISIPVGVIAVIVVRIAYIKVSLRS
jgi:hypothetical protein